MANMIQLLDSSAIGIGPAAINLKRGFREQSILSSVESIFEMGGAVSTLTNYCGKTFANLPLIIGVFTSHIPYFIGALGSALGSGPGREFLGAVGMIACTFRFFRESISLAGQRIFLSIFQRNAWQGVNVRNALAEVAEKADHPCFLKSLPERFSQIIIGKKDRLEALLSRVDAGDQKAIEKAEKLLTYWTGRNIRDCLDEVRSLHLVDIERVLPVWLYQDIVAQGGKQYLDRLYYNVCIGDEKATLEATELLNNMHSYATKKQIVHVLRIIGAVLGAIACLAFFITFPFALTIALTIILTLLSTAAFLVNTGYVENREDRFSLKICIPEFVRNIPDTISTIPEQINGFIEDKLGKKPVVSSRLLFERYRIAKASMSYEMERVGVHAKLRMGKQPRFRRRSILVASAA